MIKFSLYDFDRTIYRYDTGIRVLLYIFKTKPLALFYVPYMALSFLLSLLKIISRKQLKENFFSSISLFRKEEWNNTINKFWQKEYHNLFPHVVAQLQEDKKNGYIIGIISASAESMLYPIMDYIPADFLIGTIFNYTDTHMGSIIVGENCKNQEKVARLYKYINTSYPNQEYQIEKMYSDSLHDLPLFQIAKLQFTVEASGVIREGLPNPNKNL